MKAIRLKSRTVQFAVTQYPVSWFLQQGLFTNSSIIITYIFVTVNNCTEMFNCCLTPQCRFWQNPCAKSKSEWILRRTSVETGGDSWRLLYHGWSGEFVCIGIDAEESSWESTLGKTCEIREGLASVLIQASVSQDVFKQVTGLARLRDHWSVWDYSMERQSTNKQR